MEKIEKIAAILPAITAAAIVSAIFYNFGFIYPFGIEWISALTIKDLFSLTWTSFPILAASAVLGAATGSTTHSPSQLIAHVSNTILSANKWYSILFAIIRTIYIVGAVSIPIWASLYFSFRPPLSLEMTFRTLSIGFFIHISGVIILYRTSNDSDRLRTRTPTALYIYMAMALFIGSINGYARALSDPKYLITEADEKRWCATLVHMTDRGPLLFDPKTSYVSLVRWDMVRSLSKMRTCTLKVEEKAAVKRPATQHPQTENRPQARPKN